jgi:DNA-directed RNA polymerase subunit RPC12/RpoP
VQPLGTVLVVCPGCGRKIDLPADMVGAVIECAKCDTRFMTGVVPVASEPPAPPEDDIPEVSPATARRQRRSRRRTPARLGLILAICIPLALVATYGLCGVGFSILSQRRANNAACPNCLTETYIDYDRYTVIQQATVTRRCPTCGKSSEIINWAGGWNAVHQGAGANRK